MGRGQCRECLSLPPQGLHQLHAAHGRVSAGEGRIYRYNLNPGDRMTVEVEPVSGDPDLYVWTPNPNQPLYVSNLSGSAIDTVSFTASAAGVYQVEIYGYSSAEYQLTVTINPAGQARDHAPQQGGIDPAKSQPSQPLVSLNSEPATQQGLPTAPTSVQSPERKLFLPAVSR